ncbi:hypothetical protein ABZ912_20110 [Nonomuraea angiospora]|uniref:hypothetical protein n=1 Tax=Nonomuraea angiospora TaxID=46172 RepID=UPI00340EA4E9
MTAERKVYLVSVVPPRDKKWTPTDHLINSPCYVYGDEDLERRQSAAKEAGVTLVVQPAPNL